LVEGEEERDDFVKEQVLAAAACDCRHPFFSLENACFASLPLSPSFLLSMSHFFLCLLFLFFLRFFAFCASKRQSSTG
jgi:hypothetical protein